MALSVCESPEYIGLVGKFVCLIDVLVHLYIGKWKWVRAMVEERGCWRLICLENLLQVDIRSIWTPLGNAINRVGWFDRQEIHERALMSGFPFGLKWHWKQPVYDKNAQFQCLALRDAYSQHPVNAFRKKIEKLIEILIRFVVGPFTDIGCYYDCWCERKFPTCLAIKRCVWLVRLQRPS